MRPQKVWDIIQVTQQVISKANIGVLRCTQVLTRGRMGLNYRPGLGLGMGPPFVWNWGVSCDARLEKTEALQVVGGGCLPPSLFFTSFPLISGYHRCISCQYITLKKYWLGRVLLWRLWAGRKHFWPSFTPSWWLRLCSSPGASELMGTLGWSPLCLHSQEEEAPPASAAASCIQRALFPKHQWFYFF